MLKTTQLLRKWCTLLPRPRPSARPDPVYGSKLDPRSILKVVLEKNSIHPFMEDDVFSALWGFLRTKLECARIFKAYSHLKRTCFTFVILRSSLYDLQHVAQKPLNTFMIFLWPWWSSHLPLSWGLRIATKKARQTPWQDKADMLLLVSPAHASSLTLSCPTNTPWSMCRSWGGGASTPLTLSGLQTSGWPWLGESPWRWWAYQKHDWEYGSWWFLLPHRFLQEAEDPVDGDRSNPSHVGRTLECWRSMHSTHVYFLFGCQWAKNVLL